MKRLVVCEGGPYDGKTYPSVEEGTNLLFDSSTFSNKPAAVYVETERTKEVASGVEAVVYVWADA